MFRILAVGVASALAASVASVPAEAAVAANYAYGGTAGGTQITAAGTTIKSDLTAQSALFGFQAGTNTNKVASVSAAPLASVGAVNTDVTAVAQGDGFKLTSHARTANVNLLNGLITIDAIDTTSVASDDSVSGPAGSSQTQFLGLKIAGKQYPVNLPANFGVTIPGVATIALNHQTTAIGSDTVVSFSDGLVVTLLQPQGGAAIGAMIRLNPTMAVVQPKSTGPNAPSLGGAGYAAYVFAHIGDRIEAESGQLGGVAMPLAGTGGQSLSNSLASANVAGLLNLGAIETTATGVTTPTFSSSVVTNKLAQLTLFPSGLLNLSSLISARAIASTSQVQDVNGVFTMSGKMQVLDLQILGKSIPVDVAPNTEIHIADLGTVTLNEQKSVAIPGWVHGVQVTAVHVVLDTAKYGLPVGAEIQIGVSQALIWD